MRKMGSLNIFERKMLNKFQYCSINAINLMYASFKCSLIVLNYFSHKNNFPVASRRLQ